MKIQSEILSKSFRKANEILNQSERLQRFDINLPSIYKPKCDYIMNLVGEQGKLDFTPIVSDKIVDQFKESFKDNPRKIERQSSGMFFYASSHDDVYSSIKDLSGYERTLTHAIYSMTTEKNLIENKIHDDILSYIKNNEELRKKYSSPKLSKILVKLWGEDSNVVKWYTNHCPKEAIKGENKDYKITVSVLPHHIIGMSYYSPVNHGGGKWIDGWDGSSCMDTIRNSGGDNIVKLPPNLKDSFQAIAFLSRSDDDDFESKYLSRMLLKFVEVEKGNWIIIGLRAYNQSTTSKEILIEGLYNKFGNFHFHKDINFDSDDKVKFIQKDDIELELTYSCDCDDLDYCDCSERNETSTPYNDHSNFITYRRESFRGEIHTRIFLPKSFLDKVLNKDEEKVVVA